jgi:hypothetical protein
MIVSAKHAVLADERDPIIASSTSSQSFVHDRPGRQAGPRSSSQPQRVVRGNGDRDHRLRPVGAARELRQSGVERRFGEEHQLGALGTEHPAGVFEEGADRRIELGRAVQQPARLIQQLEALVLLRSPM